MILHQQEHRVTRRSQRDVHESTRGRVLDGVGHQIRDQPFELDTVAQDDGGRWEINLDANFAVFAGHLKLFA